MSNRLHLDFKLATTDERVAFLNKYLTEPQFETKPPTADELEIMGNYLLWGKDPQTGLNAKQTGLVNLETKHGTWDKNNDVESLEGLMESPTFSEASFFPIDAIPFRAKRETFSRSDALSKCPSYLEPSLRELFRQIDELDLMIGFWELEHEKRASPPRDLLLRRFTPEEQTQLRARCARWSSYQYLKMRHWLVELRRQQYTMRDSFSAPIIGGGTTSPCAIASPQLDADIEVLPLGTANGSPLSSLLFRPWEDLIPTAYTEDQLRQISDLYWRKKTYSPSGQLRQIDFRELEHVYQMFQMFFELDDASTAAALESNLPALMATLRFYVERADLSDMHREILEKKLHKERNTDIAAAINKKWNKSYTPNYMSTIFRQCIIPKINEAAAYHVKLAENVYFEEEFKTCSGCGRVLLRDEKNFTRKKRSRDGFASRCKKCEKLARMAQRR